MSWLLALLLLIPFGLAAVCIGIRSLLWQRRLVLLSALFQLGVAAILLMEVSKGGPLTLSAANWPAPFGIALVADMLSALLILLASLVILVGTVYLVTSIDQQREEKGFYVFLLALFGGVNGAFLTGDLFNLYVWFEVLLLASFVLLSLGGGKAQLDATVRYVVLNLSASMFFLAAVGLLYGMVGTLNLADIAVKVRALEGSGGAISAIGCLFLVAFGIKAALVPLFFWLPASYHTLPGGLAAVFAALLTKVGLYALLRLFSLIFIPAQPLFLNILTALGALTFLMGAVGALAQQDMRKTLSYLVMSSVGFIVLALSLWTTMSLMGAIFYFGHDILAKAGLFIAVGVVERRSGGSQWTKLGGWYARYPIFSAAFFVLAFSVAGLPPFSGFWGKLTLFRACIEASQMGLLAVLIVGSCLTLMTMGRLWNKGFAQQAKLDSTAPSKTDSLCVLAFAACSILLGLMPEVLMAASKHIAGELLDISPYLGAVLGGN